MHDAVALSAPNKEHSTRLIGIVYANTPALAETLLASGSALLLVLSFPDFDLSFLAWFGLVPLILATSMTDKSAKAFLLGLLWGSIFFYGTCWWLTYPMIHYARVSHDGHIPAWLAYLLFLLPVLFVALFPALFCLLLFRVIRRFGLAAIFIAPLLWVSVEWTRYTITGLAWNAIGYSQAFHSLLIQTARWGGVYAVTFLMLAVNTTFAFVILRRGRRSLFVGAIVLLGAMLSILASSYDFNRERPKADPNIETLIIGVQPNVPMEEIDEFTSGRLLEQHLQLSNQALSAPPITSWSHRVVIWPESPMNLSYSRDQYLRQVVGDFARNNQTAVLLNSLEPSAEGGEYNSAIVVNQEGQKIAQYDKIRLMPFGEYVPLPRWLPGASSVRAIVGEFKPGSSYTLMPLGDLRAGVFICIEAAHPSVARAFANEGADVLINISNDGYLGPTPVMRQHLANAIFRAVENNRPLIRVTNAGISAYISSTGSVRDATPAFQQAVRTWTISKDADITTFYSRHGDLFVYACALISLGIVPPTFMSRKTALS